MIVLFGNNLSSFKDRPEKEGWRGCGRQFAYQLRDGEHFYEDDRYLILVDSNFDQSRTDEIPEGIRRFIAAYETGLEDHSLFNGCYLIALYDKQGGQLSLWRDRSGIKTAYYTRCGQALIVGNLVHGVARLARVSSFDEETLYQLLYTFFPVDGFTWYDGVTEIKLGERLLFDSTLEIIDKRQARIELANEANRNSQADNIKLLREEITATLHQYASRDNVVLLSGGIDSVVMLAALDELKGQVSVKAASYRVKGTDQDETSYAKDMADHLGTELSIIEVDPEDASISKRFESSVLDMNNPYYGIWIFGQLPQADQQKTFFAGQDSRLHTPDMNIVDKIQFAIFSARRNRLLKPLIALLRLITKPMEWLNLSHAGPKLLKGIGRLVETLDPEEFIYRYIFKCDKRKLAMDGLPLEHLSKIRRHFTIDLKSIRNQRELYNVITTVRWQHQFAFNIRYLIDLGRLNDTYVALPFYDADFSTICSGLPLRQATKEFIGQSKFSDRKAVISKYMLRMAFRDKLTDKAFYRKKAVSMTLHLLFEGELGRTVRALMLEDMASSESFLQRFDLVDYVADFVDEHDWQKRDFKHLYNIYYLAVYCVLNKSVLTHHPDQRSTARADNESRQVAD